MSLRRSLSFSFHHRIPRHRPRFFSSSSSSSSSSSGGGKDEVERILRAGSHFDVLALQPTRVSAATGKHFARVLTPAHVKAAFQRLAKAVHPDVCAHPRAREAFGRLSDAYGTLKTPTAIGQHAAFVRRTATAGGGAHHRAANANAAGFGGGGAAYAGAAGAAAGYYEASPFARLYAWLDRTVPAIQPWQGLAVLALGLCLSFASTAAQRALQGPSGGGPSGGGPSGGPSGGGPGGGEGGASSYIALGAGAAANTSASTSGTAGPSTPVDEAAAPTVGPRSLARSGGGGSGGGATAGQGGDPAAGPAAGAAAAPAAGAAAGAAPLSVARGPAFSSDADKLLVGHAKSAFRERLLAAKQRKAEVLDQGPLAGFGRQHLRAEQRADQRPQ